ncbi:MAG: DUF1805 domain-containing protein [Gammaproteobacteria bacterium]|nr:DUF1805 domain-containing protein [Gammaproteobacteria bacterium]
MENVEKLRFDLKKPLLIVKAKNGFLACGYINPETCNKTDEACAIVTGVSNYDDMYKASVVAVSKKAMELGINPGDSGESAVQKMC